MIKQGKTDLFSPVLLLLFQTTFQSNRPPVPPQTGTLRNTPGVTPTFFRKEWIKFSSLL